MSGDCHRVIESAIQWVAKQPAGNIQMGVELFREDIPRRNDEAQTITATRTPILTNCHATIVIGSSRLPPSHFRNGLGSLLDPDFG